MTTVSGIIRDTQGNALPGLQVTVKYLRPLVGSDGGAAVENTRIFVTDSAGLLAMPNLIAGQYEIAVSVPSNSASVLPLELRRGTLTVNGDVTQTLENALDDNILITPNLIQQAINAAAVASSSAILSQAWAEGTLPGGAGTRSSREWAEVAENAVFGNFILIGETDELIILQTNPTTVTVIDETATEYLLEVA